MYFRPLNGMGYKWAIPLPAGTVNGYTDTLAYTGNDDSLAAAYQAAIATWDGHHFNVPDPHADVNHGAPYTGISVAIAATYAAGNVATYLPAATIDGRPLTDEQTFTYDALADQTARANGEVYVDSADYVYTPVVAGTPINTLAPAQKLPADTVIVDTAAPAIDTSSGSSSNGIPTAAIVAAGAAGFFFLLKMRKH